MEKPLPAVGLTHFETFSQQVSFCPPVRTGELQKSAMENVKNVVWFHGKIINFKGGMSSYWLMDLLAKKMFSSGLDDERKSHTVATLKFYSTDQTQQLL